ncbi:MAG TPA: hypothetical protein VLX92_29280 [Kofleriaceae bacterium]|nr:hypothetical protein [Kofleriaceae bacterium]
MRKISLPRVLSRLTVLALASSAAATPAIAAASSAQSSEDDAELDADVSIDREQLDPRDAAAILGRGLACALGEMKPIAATYLATSWALSEDALHRAAVASALEWAFPLSADGAVIEHLSHDTDPRIRIACARAAWVRRASGGDHGVLARLVDDPDPDVRAVARSASVL